MPRQKSASSHEDWTSEYEEDPDEDYEDRNVLRAGKQALGLSKDYVPTWKPGHAIREFYQNWKDGIMSSFDLTSSEVEVDVKGFDAKGIYTVEARSNRSRELLGFILFKDGVLDFTNFKAHMGRKALDMGHSSKRNDANAAGTHGEGFKVAALVMLRNGYRVRYESSKFYWNFQYGGRDRTMLYCDLREMQASKLARLVGAYNKKARKGDPRELDNNIWEDVSVKIGQQFRGLGNKIRIEDFRKWIKVSIDLNQPSGIIETRHGTLILDRAFQGRIYLKGLLLEGGNSQRKFIYGYNYSKGQVNRERLTNPHHEAKVLAEIWEEALKTGKEETVEKYVDMLRKDKGADVLFASTYIAKGTAKLIWQHLLAMDSERKLFYYDTNAGDTDVEIIQNSLKKKPRRLPEAIWEPLKKFNFVRTPREEQHHLLHNAPLSIDRNTPYSAGVERALRAALDFDAKTRQLDLSFKSGAVTNLDLLISKNSLQINDKWLDFQKSHDSTSCYLSLLTRQDVSEGQNFVCVHVVESLYRLILDELDRNSSHRDIPKQNSQLNHQVTSNLRRMPLKVEAEQGRAGDVIVSWMDTEGDLLSRLYGADPKCRVTLHRESTCSPDRSTLLASRQIPIAPQAESLLTNLVALESVLDNDNIHLKNADCGCPERVVSQNLLKVTFDRLSLEREVTYFPMVSRTELKAFFGLPPPNGIQSGNLIISDIKLEHESSTPRKNPLLQATVENYDSLDDDDMGSGFNDLYDASPVPSAQTSHKNAASTETSGSSSSTRHPKIAETDQAEFEPAVLDGPIGTAQSTNTSDDPRGNLRVEALNQQIRILDLKIKASDHEITTLKGDLLQSRAENNSLDATIREQKEEIDEYLSKNNDLKLKWMLCAKDLKATEERYSTCKGQLEDIQRQLDITSKELSDQRSVATQSRLTDVTSPDQVCDLKQQLASADKQLQIHLQDLKNLQKSTVGLETKYQKQTADLNKKILDAAIHQKQIDDLTKIISGLETRESNNLNSSKTLQQDNKLLADKIETLNRRLRSAEVEVDQLSTVVTSARSTRRSLFTHTSIKQETSPNIKEITALNLARLKDANEKLTQNLKSAEVEVDSLARIVDANRFERRGVGRGGGVKRGISEVEGDGGSGSQAKRQRTAVENAAGNAIAIDLTGDGE